MKRKLFIPLIFILCLTISVPCFASDTSHSGGGSYRGFIYNSDSLNSRTIQAFNNLSMSEQQDIIIECFPILSYRLGLRFKGLDVIENQDAYSYVNGYYNTRLLGYQTLYNSAEEFYNSPSVSGIEKKVFVNHSGDSYFWNDNFVDYLVTIFTVPDGSNDFVLSDTSGTNYILQQYVNDYASDHGFIDVEILSYKNLNSSVLGLIRYNKFISYCEELSSQGYKWVFLSQRGYNGGNFYYIYASKDNVYYNSSTNFINLCNDFGGNPTFKWCLLNEDLNYNPPISDWNSFTASNNIRIGAVDSFYYWVERESYISNYGCSIYNLTNNRQTYTLSNSLQGWIDTQGHFEYPFDTSSYFGHVPTITINSSDMTSYYINNYSDQSVKDSYNNTSGDNYGNPDFSSDSTWQKQPEESNFNWIERILSAIGSFISSVLKGIGDSLATIVTSVLSVLQDLFGLLTEENVVILFMRGLMSWLPTPIPEVLIAMCILSCFVGIFKIVKGLVS